jgi:hypothetical protein
MAYWFHRNPLKATKSVPFEEIKKSAKGGKINELITKLKSTRSRLLELVSKHSSNFDEVSAAFLEYLSLVRGLTEAPGEGGGESKLRYVEMFRWTNSLGGRVPSVQSDAYFEMISIMMNVGLWYTKHASHLSDNDDVNIEDAKVIHKCLKQAAGLFLYLKVCIVRYMCSVGHSQCVSLRASSLIWVLDYMDVHFVIAQLKMVSF